MGQARKRGTLEQRKAAALEREAAATATRESCTTEGCLSALAALCIAAAGLNLAPMGAASPLELKMVASRYTKRGRGGW